MSAKACVYCGRAPVWIGIGPGAQLECPGECGACPLCKAPAHRQQLESVVAGSVAMRCERCTKTWNATSLCKPLLAALRNSNGL